MTLDLPDFAINLSSADKDIKALFAKLKPEWNQDKIIVKTLSGGLSCLSCCVHLEDNTEDAYTVRVKKLFEHVENTFLSDPEFEVEAVKELSKLGLFPAVLAVFQNGFCYRYVHGKPIHLCFIKAYEKLYFDTTAVKAMVEKLAEINSVKLENKNYDQTDFFTRLEKLLKNDFKATTVDKLVLEKEFNEILSYSDKFNLRVTLCHGDAHIGNVVYKKEKGEVTFVDWEISHIGYQIYDVAYCLRMLHFPDIMPAAGFPEFPDENSKNSKKDVLKWYFDKWSELNSVNDYDEEFREFCRQVDYFELVWHLAFIIIIGSFMQDGSPEHAGELPLHMQQMASKVFEHYWKIKENRLLDLNLK